MTHVCKIVRTLLIRFCLLSMLLYSGILTCFDENLDDLKVIIIFTLFIYNPSCLSVGLIAR